jgi:hypothetical protein
MVGRAMLALCLGVCPCCLGYGCDIGVRAGDNVGDEPASVAAGEAVLAAALRPGVAAAVPIPVLQGKDRLVDQLRAAKGKVEDVLRSRPVRKRIFRFLR